MSAGPGSDPQPTSSYGPGFWVALGAGWAVIGFGIHAFLRNRRSTHPGYVLRWMLEFALAQDLVVAPAVVITGYVLGRLLPAGPVRAVVGSALVVSAVASLTAVPVLGGFSRTRVLPSLLPLDYATGLATVLGAVWGVAALILAGRLLRSRRGRPATRDR